MPSFSHFSLQYVTTIVKKKKKVYRTMTLTAKNCQKNDFKTKEPWLLCTGTRLVGTYLPFRLNDNEIKREIITNSTH